MIERSMRHKEKMKQSSFIPKPAARHFYDTDGKPEQMGMHRLQKGNSGKKKKKK
jgi:hypothetical protein